MLKIDVYKHRGIYDRIRLMILIWRMWRMVHKLYRLQKIYIDAERGGIANIDRRNSTIFDKRDFFIARDNLYIKKMDNSAFRGSAENFRKLEREFDKNEAVIENCIHKGFMKIIDNPSRRMIALTGKGLEFMDFFFFLKYQIQELGVVWKYLIFPLLTFLLGIIAKVSFSVIQEKIMELINKIKL